MCVCLCVACVRIPSEVRWTMRAAGYKKFIDIQCGCLEINLGSKEEQEVLFMVDSFLQNMDLYSIWFDIILTCLTTWQVYHDLVISSPTVFIIT